MEMKRKKFSILECEIDQGFFSQVCAILHDALDAEAQLRALSEGRLRKLLHGLRSGKHWHKIICPRDHRDTFLYKSLNYNVWFCRPTVCPLLLCLALERDDLLPELIQCDQHLHWEWRGLSAFDSLFNPAFWSLAVPAARREAITSQILPRMTPHERTHALVCLAVNTLNEDAEKLRVSQLILESKPAFDRQWYRAVGAALHAKLPRMLHAMLDVHVPDAGVGWSGT